MKSRADLLWRLVSSISPEVCAWGEDSERDSSVWRSLCSWFPIRCLQAVGYWLFDWALGCGQSGGHAALSGACRAAGRACAAATGVASSAAPLNTPSAVCQRSDEGVCPAPMRYQKVTKLVDHVEVSAKSQPIDA